MSRRLLSFFAVLTALLALAVWGPGLFERQLAKRTDAHSIASAAAEAEPKGAPVSELGPAELPRNVYLLAEGERLHQNGEVLWWQGPGRAPRRFPVHEGATHISVLEWPELSRDLSTMEIALYECFPAAVQRISTASFAERSGNLMFLDLGKACVLRVQAVDFRNRPIANAKLEAWGANHSYGSAQDCGPAGEWRGTIFQADDVSLTVSAEGFAPCGVRMPRPAAGSYSEQVPLPRILAGGIVLDRQQDTLYQAVGGSGWPLDLTPWSEERLAQAEARAGVDADFERVMWFTEYERYGWAPPVIRVYQSEAHGMSEPIVTELVLRPVLDEELQAQRVPNDFAQTLLPVEVVLGPDEALLSGTPPDRLVLGIDRGESAIVAQAGYRVAGDAPRYRFFVRPGWMRFVSLNEIREHFAADYPPIVSSDWFVVPGNRGEPTKIELELERDAFYAEYRFLDEAGRAYPGAGRLYGVARNPVEPRWSPHLVRSPRALTSYFRDRGEARLWLARRNGVASLVDESFSIRRPAKGQALEVVVTPAMLAKLASQPR